MKQNLKILLSFFNFSKNKDHIFLLLAALLPFFITLLDSIGISFGKKTSVILLHSCFVISFIFAIFYIYFYLKNVDKFKFKLLFYIIGLLLICNVIAIITMSFIYWNCGTFLCGLEIIIPMFGYFASLMVLGLYTIIIYFFNTRNKIKIN